MKWLAALIAAVVQALLPWLARRSKPTAEDADPARDERDKLRERIREHWGTSKPKGDLSRRSQRAKPEDGQGTSKPTGEDGWRDE